MRWKKTLQLAEVHCEGEVGKVITAGVIDIPGETMQDKMNYINEVDDSLRRLVMLEPRGCLQMSVNLLLPPSRPEADVGFIVLQADRAHPMSGSNSICVVTALLELGMLPMTEPESIVVLDTAAGLVKARAYCHNGKCVSVSLDMPASFVEHLDHKIETTSFGWITADIAFGGCYYALVDVEQFGLTIAPENARELGELGVKLKYEINQSRLDIQHPEFADLNDVAYVMFRNKIDDTTYQTCTTVPPGRVDRSPCGTGSSANLSTLAARGLADIGSRLVSRSIIGGEFKVDLLGMTQVGDKSAVFPRIEGRAWIYGLEQIGIDPDDPMEEGFMLSDTWGPSLPK